MADDAEDPWGFLAARKSAPESAPRSQGAETADSSSDDVDWGAIAQGRTPKRERGELRAEMAVVSLRRRGWPLAVALVLVFTAGFITEVVASSQMISLAGTGSVLYIYPLGGIGLIALALLQYRFVDHAARLAMLRIAALGYAAVLAIAWIAILAGVVPVFATGVVWLLADQINFLLPVLIWSLAADEFNVAEARKIFGWLVAWTYVGQVLGLTVALLGPLILKPLDLPLPVLLGVAPAACVILGVWLPSAMKKSGAAKGTAQRQTYSEAFADARDFVKGVPVWRNMIIASTLTFIAGTTVIMGFAVGVGDNVGADAANMQMIFSGAWLAALVICWLIQTFASERIADRLGISVSLIVLPIATAGAAIVLGLGFALQSIPVLIAAISIWRLPRWSIDENARRSALALVPDDKRARISFLNDLMPVAVGLILAAPIVGVGFLTDQFWIAGAIALVIALAAIPFARKVIAGWDDSMMNWRLRRRKQNRSLDFGEAQNG